MGTIFYYVADNHVSDHKQLVSRQLGNVRRPVRNEPKKQVTLNVQRRKKLVENRFDDCGGDISSIVKDFDTYHAIA